MDKSDRWGKILIVDDDEDVQSALSDMVKPHALQVKTTGDIGSLSFLMRSFMPDIILLDMNFSQNKVDGSEGFACLEKIQQIDPDVVVLFLTAYVDVENVIQAVRKGVFDYITKPWDNGKLLATLASAWKMRTACLQNIRLRHSVEALTEMAKSGLVMIGESPAILQVQRLISQVAKADPPVLILGESGTGKDVAAQLLWKQSSRASAPFVRIDLSSIPETLFESELFGYEKGAFTDAKTSKPGRMELASGGTLFLDEIGNLPLHMQSKLLTALEKKEIVRVGGRTPIHVDARIIAATNEDLDALVDVGRFRQDLLFRINTIEFTMPPLRERGQDIMLLAEYFRQRAVNEFHIQIKGFTAGARRKLMSYNWPGNVRELQHVIDRAVLTAGQTLITEESLTWKGRKNTEGSLHLKEMERQTIKAALDRTNQNLSKAADLLGISRFSLYRKMKEMSETESDSI